MRYINSRFTYLLNYSLIFTYLPRQHQAASQMVRQGIAVPTWPPSVARHRPPVDALYTDDVVASDRTSACSSSCSEPSLAGADATSSGHRSAAGRPRPDSRQQPAAARAARSGRRAESVSRRSPPTWPTRPNCRVCLSRRTPRRASQRRWKRRSTCSAPALYSPFYSVCKAHTQ